MSKAIPGILRLFLLVGIGVVCNWIAWFPVGMASGGAPLLSRPLYWQALGVNLAPLIVLSLMIWFLTENRKANLIALLAVPVLYNVLNGLSVWG